MSMKVAVRLMGYLWRPLTDSEEDTEFVLKMRNSPSAQEGFFTPHVSREEHMHFLRAPEREEEINWIIEKDSERVGASGIYRVDRKNRRAESGRIVAKEAPVFAFNVFVSSYVVFEYLGLNKMVGDALASNSVVNWALQSIGGAKEGLLREHVFKDGVFKDVYLYGTLASDWKRMKSSLIAQFGEPRIIRHYEDAP
jgi:RimJ/RimL family protein N-acetyltransferase